MLKQNKTIIIDRLADAFTRSNSGILTDYRGLKAAEITALRRKVREAKGEYHVVKNTLARLAAKKTNRDDLVPRLEGTMAIAFGYGDAVELSRTLTEYLRSSKLNVAIKGGFLGARVLTPDEVGTLATLPRKEILIAQVLAGMQAPIATLLNYLTAPLSDLRGVLQARIAQLEGGQS